MPALPPLHKLLCYQVWYHPHQGLQHQCLHPCQKLQYQPQDWLPQLSATAGVAKAATIITITVITARMVLDRFILCLTSFPLLNM